MSDVKKSIELNPRHFESYLILDSILARKGKFNDIINYWSKLIELEPKNARAYLERGGAYYHKGDLRAALIDAKKSCELGNNEGCKRFKQMERLLY